MHRRSLMLLCLCASLVACGGGGPVTDEEATKFQDLATDQVPQMGAYGDDVFKNIATNVCTLLKGKDTTAADAVGVMDNYSEIPADKRALVVGLAAGSACPQFKSKIK
jgi:hypothetical protein